MKKLIFVTFLFLVIFGSDFAKDKESVDENKTNTPVYEEFTVEVDTIDYYINTTTELKSNPQVFELSSENLNEFLASPEQVVIFSFKTESGKTLSLLTDAKENYLIYRYGKPEKVEFIFPENVDNTSWQKFNFKSYKTDNENLQHVYFVNFDYQYTIYYNEYPKTPTDNKTGVQVKSLNNNKTTDIRAVKSSVKGSLSYFKNNNKISK